MKEYDYIIVGGGPVGIILSLCLARNNNNKVLLIDSNQSLGECHRIKKINGLLTEYEPKIYLSNFTTFENILEKFDINLYDYFKKYDFTIFGTFKNIISNLQLREIFILSLHYIFLGEMHKSIKMVDFLSYYNFKDKSIVLIDSICKISDGAGIDKFSVFSFFKFFDINIMCDTYIPKYTNDLQLFEILQKKLMYFKVDILLNSKVVDLYREERKITSCMVIKNKEIMQYYAKNFILAISPSSIINIISKSNDYKIQNCFGDLKKFKRFAKKNECDNFINIMYYWNKKITFNKISGILNTRWGIFCVMLSDYIKFENYHPKTVVSVSITKKNVSPRLNKNPDQCTNEELIKETFIQMMSIYGKIPKYDNALLDKTKTHNATFYHNNGILEEYSKFNNLYNCGRHNGYYYNDYPFTSIESASINALHLYKKLNKIDGKNYKIILPNGFRKNMLVIIILLIIMYICLNSNNRN